VVNPISNAPQMPSMTPKPGVIQQSPVQPRPVDQTTPLMPNQQMPNIIQQQPPQQAPQAQQPAQTQQAQQAVAQKVVENKNKEENKVEIDKRVEANALQGIRDKSQEKEIVKNMKQTIENEAKRVSRKVNRSALKYILKNTDWIAKDKAAEAEEFLTIKVPKVLAEELTHILSDVLGLEQVEEV
jgi:hypothetical protein